MRVSIAASLLLVCLSHPAAAAEIKARTLGQPTMAPPNQILFLDAGRLVLVDGSSEQGETIWTLIERTTGQIVRTHTDAAAGEIMVFGPDDRSGDGAISLAVQVPPEAKTDLRSAVRWPDARPIARLDAGERPRLALRGPGDPRLVTERVVAGADGQPPLLRLRIWAPTGERVQASVDIPGGTPGDTYAEARMVAAPEGRWMAVIRSGALSLVASDTGAISAPRQDAARKYTGAGFSRDGTRLFTAAEGEPIQVFGLPDLQPLRTIPTGDIGIRFTMGEVADGRVIAIGGRRQTSYVDAASGRAITHARGSSVSSYRLLWLETGHVLRASRTRMSPITYGAYRHAGGDFKRLYKREWTGGKLGALVVSPNGRCMLLSSKANTALLAPATGREIARIRALPEGLETAAITADGRSIVGADSRRQMWTFETPPVCHGAAL